MSIIKRGFTTFDIKVIGIILMFIDHIHQMFIQYNQVPNWLDYFGRPVATMFFFVSVIGFYHTHSKKQYMMRLYIGLVVLNLGSNILQRLLPSRVILSNDIFADLFLGVLMMFGIDFLTHYRNSKHPIDIIKGILLLLSPLLLSIPFLLIFTNINSVTRTLITILQIFVPSVLNSENNFMIYMIPLLYLFKHHKIAQSTIIAVVSLIYLIFGGTQWIMIFAIPFVLLYNGNKGKGMKGFFYVFYPIHIWLLYALSYIINVL